MYIQYIHLSIQTVLVAFRFIGQNVRHLESSEGGIHILKYTGEVGVVHLMLLAQVHRDLLQHGVMHTVRPGV